MITNQSVNRNTNIFAMANTVDNILFFVDKNFDTLNRQELNTLIFNFYHLDELTASKAILIAECKKIGITDAIAESSKKRLHTKTESDLKQRDIKGHFGYLDCSRCSKGWPV